MRRCHLHRHVVETLSRFGYRIDASGNGLMIRKSLEPRTVRGPGGTAAYGGIAACVPRQGNHEQGQ